MSGIGDSTCSPWAGAGGLSTARVVALLKVSVVRRHEAVGKDEAGYPPGSEEIQEVPHLVTCL
jgi:hypothetical protein